MTQKVPQKRKKVQEVTIEDIYNNKNFVKPKEKPLETIFEEPKVSRDGIKHYTSIKRYKRYLLFDDYPNSDKLRKRKMRVKKLMKCPLPEGRLTRSRNKRPRLLSDLSEQEFGGGDGVMICMPDVKNSSMLDSIIQRNRMVQHDGYALRAASTANYKEASSEDSESDEDLYRVPVKVIVAEDSTRSCSAEHTHMDGDMDLVIEDEDMVVQTDVSDSDEIAKTENPQRNLEPEFKHSALPSKSAPSASAETSLASSERSSFTEGDKSETFCVDDVTDSRDLMTKDSSEEAADCSIKTNMCEVT